MISLALISGFTLPTSSLQCLHNIPSGLRWQKGGSLPPGHVCPPPSMVHSVTSASSLHPACVTHCMDACVKLTFGVPLHAYKRLICSMVSGTDGHDQRGSSI